MVQFLEREPTTAERFGKAFSNLGQTAATGIPQMLMGQKQKEAISKQFGEDIANLPPDLQKEYMVQLLKNGAKNVDKTQPFVTGLSTINRMRNLLKGGRVGTYTGRFPLDPFASFGKKGRDRSEFAQLGTSLIPLVAAGVPIRNQKEFEKYSKIITDPDATEAQIEGALQGLEFIFQQQLGMSSSENERPSLESFYE